MLFVGADALFNPNSVPVSDAAPNPAPVSSVTTTDAQAKAQIAQLQNLVSQYQSAKNNIKRKSASSIPRFSKCKACSTNCRNAASFASKATARLRCRAADATAIESDHNEKHSIFSARVDLCRQPGRFFSADGHCLHTRANLDSFCADDDRSARAKTSRRKIYRRSISTRRNNFSPCNPFNRKRCPKRARRASGRVHHRAFMQTVLGCQLLHERFDGILRIPSDEHRHCPCRRRRLPPK